jgi:signal transduction histidine kinase
MFVPLRARGRTLGAMALIDCDASVHFSGCELDVALELADRAAAAIDNAILYEESQRAIQSRDSILATVSHDLRNPLSAVLTAASFIGRLALTDDRGERLRKQAEVIERAARRMNVLIGDLLDVASIEAGRLSIDPRENDPSALIDESVEAYRTAACAKTIELAWSQTAASRPVLCDRVRVLQVLGNLIGNAINFTPAGGVVQVRFDELPGRTRFVVSDTGPGIPADDVPRVFEPFWHSKRGNSRGGTGLGLFIAKGLVEAHGGRIEVHTEEHRGSTFEFTLPTARPRRRRGTLARSEAARARH